MYDDAWYNAFVPSSQPKAENAGHRRRQSLLKQPHESNGADVRVIEEGRTTTKETPGTYNPPQATIARRAKSYGDFYDIVREHAAKEHKSQKANRKSHEDIKTELDLVNWYNGISEDLGDSSSEDYRVYQGQLSLARSHLDSMLDSTNSSLDLLSSLTASFRAVETQTAAFRAQCEELLAEQTRLSKLADDIAENARYYDYLEPITRRLNAPGAGTSVRSKEFSEMLSNLDHCLEYMQAHSNHREAPTYRSRYRLLLTRALTLIRVHFTNTLREIAADASKRIANKQLPQTAVSALLYARFRVVAPQLKRLGHEIQKRAMVSAGAEAGAEAEYQSLMNELYQSYAATRGRLIMPVVTKRIKDISAAPSSSKDLIAFARSSVGYIHGICLDEIDLWREWFDQDGGVYDFLEAVCEPLYDHIRPRIIRETQLLKLCELCTLLQSRYMDEEEDDVEPPPPNQLDFARLIHPALQDAQTRLVFLTLAILRNDIEHYKPKPEDIDFSARNRHTIATGATNQKPVLSGRKDTANGTPAMNSKSPIVGDEDGVFEGIDIKGGLRNALANPNWYPTLRKAIWLLSNIYRLVNSTVFDDLAHQIVHQTIASLHNAASLVSNKASVVDGQLFLIVHLLILKQQIVAFDIEFVTPEVSFAFPTVTNTFWELRDRGGLFNPANLIRLVGSSLIPRVVENMLDAKVELDGRLRTVINDFVNGFAVRMTAAISESASAKTGFDGREAVKVVMTSTEQEVPSLRQKLNEYIDDAQTKETLVGAIQDQVLQNYEEFFSKYTAQIRANGKAVSHKGKGREDEVWDPETFAEWSDGVFRVGRRVGEMDGEDTPSSLSRSGSG